MYVIIYDFGTSSVKTCLFQIDSEIHLVTSASAAYSIYISDDGGRNRIPKSGGRHCAIQQGHYLKHPM